ncbi:MAG: ABC transporter ATP-binding protein, partial [Bdellovibrionales bacterium]|nr:ABC transporter ATP-binding protein [Bdellovibrionales bacterium]
SAEESLGGIRTVKAFTGEPFEVERFVSRIQEVRGFGFQRSRFAAFFASAVNFLMNVSLVVVLLVGLQAVSDSTMTAGDLTAFLLYGVIVAISFAFLAGSIAELYQASGAAERVFETINAEEEISASETGASPQPISTVTFQQVSFSYPTRTEDTAISELSFSASKGEFIALVGPSGAGKSTIMNLLLRFYEPKSGAILFDDHDISKRPIREIRSHIGLVPQDPLLFADTIEANLRYGTSTATLEELEEVCRRSSIFEFIQSLPQGFKTYVGERGVQLSGGQKQRLAIARALLKKPDILLLDEATSSLDSESEAAIKRSLERIKNDCILIAIAHRLSTVQNADKILVINHGRLVEKGTHLDLVSKKGIYQELVSYQELVNAK